MAIFNHQQLHNNKLAEMRANGFSHIPTFFLLSIIEYVGKVVKKREQEKQKHAKYPMEYVHYTPSTFYLCIQLSSGSI